MQGAIPKTKPQVQARRTLDLVLQNHDICAKMFFGEKLIKIIWNKSFCWKTFEFKVFAKFGYSRLWAQLSLSVCRPVFLDKEESLNLP